MRLPDHLKPERSSSESVHSIKSLLRSAGLHTVCESARCPNMGECFSRRVATFMILGDSCTRSCSFCAVKNASPLPPDPDEPARVAKAAAKLGLKYVVVTSVTRDDLPDGGARHFAETLRAAREVVPEAGVEVLIPDFGGSEDSLRIVIDAAPDVLNHNVETAPRLYPHVRPQADYGRSLKIIARANEAGLTAKSGMMLGMGEEQVEVIDVMADLRNAGCDVLTLGQYLQPTRANMAVHRYLDPGEFDEYHNEGLKLGFKYVFAGPLVRSSYRAGELPLK